MTAAFMPAVRWTRLSYRGFPVNAARLQLHTIACNLGILLRTLTLPEGLERWSLTTLRERLVKIGAKDGDFRPPEPALSRASGLLRRPRPN